MISVNASGADLEGIQPAIELVRAHLWIPEAAPPYNKLLHLTESLTSLERAPPRKLRNLRGFSERGLCNLA